MPNLVPIESYCRSWLDAGFAYFGGMQPKATLVFAQQLFWIACVHTLGGGGVFLFGSLLHCGSDEQAQEAEMGGKSFGICAESLGEDDEEQVISSQVDAVHSAGVLDGKAPVKVGVLGLITEGVRSCDIGIHIA